MFRKRSLCIAVVVGAIAGALATWNFMPTKTVVRQERVTEWRPGFCATFLSRDNVPLAVCGDYFYPVYSGAPEGYKGLLKDCFIGAIGPIRGCRTAKL
jgi:hypothetical protein